MSSCTPCLRPGDYVTRRGEVGTMMFFVVRGVLTIFVPGNRSSVASDFENAINGRRPKESGSLLSCHEP
eukprot:3558530-Amphidinium_carterae.1